jgi:hypothetical protein
MGVGVCLSKRAVSWYEAAGSTFVPLCGRFCTFNLLIGNSMLHFIVWYAPTTGHTATERQNSLDKLDGLINDCPNNHLLIVMGDANAAIGPYSPLDNVCGKLGNPAENGPGINLRALLAMQNLYAPVTRYTQTITGTWHHPQSNTLHQCDNIFLRWDDRRAVRKCWNSMMLTSTNHYSMRLQIDLSKIPPPPKTLRSQRTVLDYDALFTTELAAHTSAALLREIKPQLRPISMQNLEEVLACTISKLPKKPKPDCGWYDKNHPTIAALIETRNNNNDAFAKSPSAQTKATYRASDKKLQKALLQLENNWWIQQLNPPTPGTAAVSRSPYSHWQQAQHALRGAEKWKCRNRSFVRDANGVQATTSTENIQNVCNYFGAVFNFPTNPSGIPHIHRMKKKGTGPQLHAATETRSIGRSPPPQEQGRWPIRHSYLGVEMLASQRRNRDDSHRFLGRLLDTGAGADRLAHRVYACASEEGRPNACQKFATYIGRRMHVKTVSMRSQQTANFLFRKHLSRIFKWLSPRAGHARRQLHI